MVLLPMVELFDDPEIDCRTPLASPFDLDAVREYLAVIRRTRAEGRRIQLAITADRGWTRGEVVLTWVHECPGRSLPAG